MGKIYVLMGKSATGKDTVFKRLIGMKELALRTVVGYTTRPIRRGEADGKEYFFVSVEKWQELQKENKVIESRTYHTVVGDWHYFTVDDGQIDLEGQDYLFISTLSGYEQLKKFYGEDVVLPLYVEVEDDQRLWRSICRERRQAKPNYDEVCRRFLADQQDFSEEEIIRLGIGKRSRNSDLDECVKTIARDIADLKGN
ncbi:MAG: guanylate kinase [Lachnospiraceae bacterium]|nr:guanylate kinase [Lachnospiraceae bacterium]